jgi:hypothetical protein
MAEGADRAAASRGRASVVATGPSPTGPSATAQAGGPAAPPAKVIATAKVATAKVATAGSKRKTPRAAVSKRERIRRIFVGFGRYGVWAIPIFALISGLAPRSSAAFTTDPQVYAGYVATGRHDPREMVVLISLAVFGVVSILALGALLARGRARWTAIAGLVAGCLGAAAMLWEIDTMIIRAQRLRHDLLSGNFGQIVLNPHASGGTAVLLALGGAALLILAWFLYGIAVFRTGGMNRTDGILLIISAPMLYAGGMVLNMIPILGSFLLLAAGLGIGLSASRLVPAGQLDVAPPHYERGAMRPLEPEQVDDFALLPAASAQPAASTQPAASAQPAASTQPAASAQPEQPQPTVPPDAVVADPGAAGVGPGSKPERGGRHSGDRRSPTSWTVSRDKPDDEAVATPSPTPAGVKNVTGATNMKPVPAGRGLVNGGSVNAGSVTGGPVKRAARSGDSGASTKTGLTAKSSNSPGSGTPNHDKRDRNRGPGGKSQPDGSKGPAAGPE